MRALVKTCCTFRRSRAVTSALSLNSHCLSSTAPTFGASLTRRAWANMSSPPPALSFWDKSPPLAILAAARIGQVSLDLQPNAKATKDTAPQLTFASGELLAGVPLILRYLARVGTQSSELYGEGPLAACQVDYWLDHSVNVVSGATLEAQCEAISDFLQLRTFLVGYNVTVADVAVWGQLAASPMWPKVKRSPKVNHLSRWFDFCASLPQMRAVIEEHQPKRPGVVTAAGADATAARKASGAEASSSGQAGSTAASFEMGLPGAVHGKVVTRFPPEPSGYLHIGHAKAALLNAYFAEMYGGKVLLRFDDTNPSKEKDEFVENILKDVADLGVKYERLTHTSDYFPQLLDIGERLIKAGVLYADDTLQEQMRDERLNSVESKCRNRTVEENLKIWEEMKVASEIGLANCMRFKIDMKSANGAMRDPVAFRCNLTPHWRTGTKYKLYPTYDCACPFVDSFEGVTHALRTSEYRDREEQFYWVLKAMQKVWPGLPDVIIWDYSRLNFINTVLSKRKLTWFVETGRVSGWNDPRMPTVQGILRRGLRMEALREFILAQGASKNMTYQEWDKIWTINKKLIDPVCPRHTAVETAGKVPVTITNLTDIQVVTVPKHKKYPPAGLKALTRSPNILLDQADAQIVTENEEVTLMDWGNAIIRTITKDASGTVTAMTAELHLMGDFKKTKWKLTWLAQSEELVPLSLVNFDYLIWKKRVEEEDNFESLVNPVTRMETAALGDPNMRSLAKGDVIQLERKGYFIVDEPLIKAGKPLMLLSIPDGRTVKPFNQGGVQPTAV